jgi:hypothetical protein
LPGCNRSFRPCRRHHVPRHLRTYAPSDCLRSGLAGGLRSTGSAAPTSTAYSSSQRTDRSLRLPGACGSSAKMSLLQGAHWRRRATPAPFQQQGLKRCGCSTGCSDVGVGGRGARGGRGSSSPPPLPDPERERIQRLITSRPGRFTPYPRDGPIAFISGSTEYMGNKCIFLREQLTVNLTAFHSRILNQLVDTVSCSYPV